MGKALFEIEGVLARLEDVPNFDEYSERLVAFVDILGFTNAVRAIEDGRSFEVAAAQLLLVKRQAEMWAAARGFLDGFETTAVSDSLIISVPWDDPIATIGLVKLVQGLQYEFLVVFGMLFRGYIDKGPCYHKDGVLFGGGYIGAYRGEVEGQGGPPRVVYPKHLVDEAKEQIGGKMKSSRDELPATSTVFEMIARDEADGQFFVDYLAPLKAERKFGSPATLARELNEFIRGRIDRFAAEPQIRKKWVWLREYLMGTDIGASLDLRRRARSLLRKRYKKLFGS